jgi:hypothetical protein
MISVGILGALVLAAGVTVASTEDLPTFDRFPAKEYAVSTPAPVLFSSHRDARSFRTVLREGAKLGPNFAGHFTVVTWGCGTACQRLAIVDAKNGRVFFPPQLQPNAYHMVTDGSDPFQYRRDSALLIVTGAPMDREDEGIYYYRWNGKQLKQLRYVPKTWQR